MNLIFKIHIAIFLFWHTLDCSLFSLDQANCIIKIWLFQARNQEYKDPIEEEWDKFIKAIKEADNVSNAIIAEDQEEATTERQIDEIDEQMKKLSK